MSKLIKPKNTLKEKAGHGGFKKEDLAKAQSAIDNNTVEFEPIGRELFSEIEDVLKLMQAEGSDVQSYMGVLLDPLMKLRAQGTLFHYPSITQISDVVVDFLDTEKHIDGDIVEILLAYKKAGDAILSLQIKDVKNKTCMVLVKELKSVCLRYQQKKKS